MTTNTDHIIPEITAVRTWNKPRTKATVTVRIRETPGVDRWATHELGGNRAARAQAVVVAAYETIRMDWDNRDENGCATEIHTGEYPAGIHGCRGDLAKAQTEAHRMATATTLKMRGRFGAPGRERPIRTAAWAVAVPVTEG